MPSDWYLTSKVVPCAFSCFLGLADRLVAACGDANRCATGGRTSDCGSWAAFISKLRGQDGCCGNDWILPPEKRAQKTKPCFWRWWTSKTLVGSNAALIVFEFEQKLRLSETEIFGPKPLSFRCTSIKKVTIFREFPLYHWLWTVTNSASVKRSTFFIHSSEPSTN